MKILLATHRYPAPDRPDLVSDVDALRVFAAQWVAAGHEVTIAHLYQHENRDGRKKPPLYGCRIEESSLDGARIVRAECRYIRRLPKLARAYFKRIAVAVSERLGECDIVLAHFPTTLGGFAESIAPDAPRVAVLHNTDIDRLERARLRYPIEKLGAYDGFGYRSAAIKRRFEAIARFDRPSFMALSGAPACDIKREARGDGCLRVIYAGKLIARKNVKTIISALCALPEGVDWRFTAIGDGPLRAELEARAGRSGASGRVDFTGALPREDVLRKMAEADVFCMVSENETFGLVYLEAMGRGLITIGSAGEGVDEIIEDGVNGYLADPKDEAALAALFARIADMPEARSAEMREAAMATADSMGEADMARAYLESAVKCAAEYRGRREKARRMLINRKKIL